MLDDLHFRVALIVIATLHLIAATVLLGRAKADTPLSSARAEGPLLAWSAAIAMTVYALGAAVWLFQTHWILWVSLPLPDYLRWCGAPTMALGAALHLWGARHLGANFTETIETRTFHELVTTGPYRWVRHPLYLGDMIETLGVALLSANVVVVAGATAFWWVVVLRTPREEALLAEALGAPYLAYQSRTGRFLPRFLRPPTSA